MEHYVGLDVSLKLTSICVVNQTRSIVQEGVVDSDPEAIASFVRLKAPGTVGIGIETGPTTTWLWTELNRLRLRVICIDARHAKAVLKLQIDKSDRKDAAAIARIMGIVQTGWFKEVHVKDLDSHAVRALLASRELLVKIKRDLENQVRGLLKNFGLVFVRAKFDVFAARAEELIEDRPELVAAIRPLLEARKAIEKQVGDLGRKVHRLARHDCSPQVHDRTWCRPDHRTVLQGDDQRSDALQAIEKCRRLYRIDDPTPCLRGVRLVRQNLEVR
jgi:transposase